MDKYIISKEHMDEIIKKSSRSLVGTLLKRIEVLEEQKTLTSELYKSLIRELVYENYRQLKALIQSFSSGVKFINKPKDE